MATLRTSNTAKKDGLVSTQTHPETCKGKFNCLCALSYILYGELP